LLALLARIASGNPETYWDVQAGNPHARSARTALATGLARMGNAAEHGTRSDFAAIVERAGRSLDPAQDDYTRICEDLFQALPDRVARNAVT
jgi:prephenate dehydrogenase